MEIKNLSMSFGTQELYKDINLHIKEKAKTGIVGPNGVGKTTLFKIMLHQLEADTGKIIFEQNDRIEWLPQIITDDLVTDEITVLAFLSVGRPIEKLNNELQRLYEKLKETSDAMPKAVLNKIDKIQVKLEYWNCYGAEAELLKIMEGMDITPDMWDKKISELSGGQKSKIAFARLLYSHPEVMLLDEPTNHLDKKTKDYVINYLKNYKGSIFVISHDIEFLNAITNQILFIDKQTKSFKIYPGNYDNFLKLSQEQEKSRLDKAKNQQREEEKLRAIINKYSNSSGKRKKMAQDREKKLARLLQEKIELNPKVKYSKVNLKMARCGNNVPLRVTNLAFKYPNMDEYLYQNLTFTLTKGEKFLIVGENGIGKSTLLKLIMGILTPSEGMIEIGNKMDLGYYAQEHELLDINKTIMENFQNVDMTNQNLRSFLGNFLFSNDDVNKKISVLSPGERSRVALAKLALTEANFLILDEPTNHLDPETQMIIAATFKDFAGTMLVVSHNPDFVDNLGIERVLLLPSGKILYYNREIVEHFEKLNTQDNN